MEYLKKLKPRRLSYEPIDGENTPVQTPCVQLAETESASPDIDSPSSLSVKPSHSANGENCDGANQLRAYRRLRIAHWMQACFLVVAFVCCVAAGQQLSIANTDRLELDTCVLFSKWTLVNISSEKAIMLGRTAFKKSSKALCDTVEFGFFSAGILAAVLLLLTLYTIPNASFYFGKEKTKVPELTAAVLIFAVISVTLCFVLAAVFTAGFVAWCANFVGYDGCGNVAGKVYDGTIAIASGHLKNYYSYLIVAVIFAWSGVVGWICIVTTVAWRIACKMDFSTSLQLQPEKVHKIVPKISTYDSDTDDGDFLVAFDKGQGTKR